MTCCVCRAPAAVSHRYEDHCQFHWDCLRHELRLRLDAIRDHGQYHRGNCGPNFMAIFHGYLFGNEYHEAGFHTLGYGLYVSTEPREAMLEALHIAQRNGWKLLRLDVQGGSEKRLKIRSCTDIFVSHEYHDHMPYSYKSFLPYDEKRYGSLSTWGN